MKGYYLISNKDNQVVCVQNNQYYWGDKESSNAVKMATVSLADVLVGYLIKEFPDIFNEENYMLIGVDIQYENTGSKIMYAIFNSKGEILLTKDPKFEWYKKKNLYWGDVTSKGTYKVTFPNYSMANEFIQIALTNKKGVAVKEFEIK